MSSLAAFLFPTAHLTRIIVPLEHFLHCSVLRTELLIAIRDLVALNIGLHHLLLCTLDANRLIFIMLKGFMI